MITRRMASALVGASLAVGLVAGMAGTIIAKDATPSQSAVAACIDHMDDMGSMMNGTGGMMNGTGGMIGGAGMMSGLNGPGSMPDWMQQHHGAATPTPAQ